LPVLPLQRSPDGACRIWLGTADGTSLEPTRIPTISVYASTNLAQPLSAWTRLTGSFTASNGMLWIDDPAARNLSIRFYRASERP
jgi:hypothetical protein